MIKGHNNYLVSVVKAFNVLNINKGDLRHMTTQRTNHSGCRGHMLSQSDGGGSQRSGNSGLLVRDMYVILLSHVTFYQCGSHGQYSDKLPISTPKNMYPTPPHMQVVSSCEY